MATQRKDLFDRLPQIWRKLDTQGVLERFLNVVDSDFNRIELLIDSYLEVHNINKIPDAYLNLLGTLVGHQWKSSRSRLWNRNRIRDSIKKYSYKGTFPQYEDVARDYGTYLNRVQDNASKLLILGKQGRLSYDDAYIVAPDYWHDGAYIVEVDWGGSGDPELLAELLANRPAGYVWFIEFKRVSHIYYYADIIVLDRLGGMSSNQALNMRIGYGCVGDNLLVSSEPNGFLDWSYKPIYWQVSQAGLDLLGETLLDTEVNLSHAPAYTPEWSYKPLYWINTYAGSFLLGESILGEELYLAHNPEITSWWSVTRTGLGAVFGGSISMDSAITCDNDEVFCDGNWNTDEEYKQYFSEYSHEDN